MTGRTLRYSGGCLGVVAFIIVAYLAWLPDVTPLKKENPRTTRYLELYVRRKLAKGERPAVSMRWVPLDQISPYLRQCVLMAEDDRFYRHRGVDWAETKRAFEKGLKDRQFSRGASTISQQVARNLYLSPKPTLGRKVREILIARYLDQSLGKDRVLEIYLNIAEWGKGIFGAEAASQFYFSKSAADLTPEEAVDLVVALPSPYRYNPDNPPVELTLKKRELFLERLRRRGIIPSEPPQ